MSKYRAHRELKRIDTNWEVAPSHWTFMQLKRAVDGCKNGVWGSDPDMDDNDIVVVRVADFDREKLTIKSSDYTLRKIEQKDREHRLLKNGDLLLEKSGGGEKTPVGQVVLFDKNFDAVTSNFVAKMTPLESHDSKFLNYMFACIYDSKLNTCSIKQNTGIQNIDSEAYLSEKFCFPPRDEQTQIATFLDRETAKIDRLIEKQQRLIELLQEKRQAVISHVVTKGLNPDAPMKDSGAEWLGEVPEHWVIKNYRYAARIYRGKFGHRPRNDPDFYDGPYPFIQTGDIAQADKKITHFKQTLNERGISVSQKFPSGALVMAIAANIGDTAILDFEAYAPDSVVGFKPKNNIDLEFLRYSLMAALQELEKTSTQSSQANLNIDRIGSVKAAFPPIKEQMEIVSMLDNLNHKYERVKLNALSGIELLKERRTALISAAVTGKIDVRECIISPASEAADIALAEQASL